MATSRAIGKDSQTKGGAQGSSEEEEEEKDASYIDFFCFQNTKKTIYEKKKIFFFNVVQRNLFSTLCGGALSIFFSHVRYFFQSWKKRGIFAAEKNEKKRGL
jgi:hypothetical protein